MFYVQACCSSIFFTTVTRCTPGKAYGALRSLWVVACVVLVLVAKQIRKVVMVSERYYGDG